MKGAKLRYLGSGISAIGLVMALAAPAARAQEPAYDLLLTGGHVIDPANEIDGVRDVAVRDGKIVRVAAGISPQAARRTVDVKGLYVVPGLVDIHSHHYGYSGALFPDDTALPAGTTTVVDAGGPGWRNFEDFRRTVIDRAGTRVLALLNIAGFGMLTDVPEQNVLDMDAKATSDMAGRHRDVVVGIKTAH